MEYIFQFLIILLVTFMGEIIHELIPLPVPAGIYGLIIMFICLKTRLIPLIKIRKTALFLLEIMPVMFIPMSVGLMAIYRETGAALFYIALISAVSTTVVMVFTGHSAQLILRIGRRNRRG